MHKLRLSFILKNIREEEYTTKKGKIMYRVKTSFTTLLLAVLFTLPNLGVTMTESKDYTSKINSLLSRMTVEEKIGQLSQYSGTELTGPKGGKIDVKEEIKKGRVGSLLNVTGAEETEKLQNVAMKQSRLGIPIIFGLDVIHGYKTIFPVPLAMASSWDMDMIKQASKAAAIEASASGIQWTFTPMVDIARDPRWGRIVEGAGEDPYLGSEVAKAQVTGFQGESLANIDTILACAKHFIGYGAAIAGRDYNNVEISNRTLWEIYIPPFKAAIDAGVETVMSAFNDLNGIPMTGNKKLLTDVLRDKLGFKGFIVSDWNSIAEMIPHGYAKNRYQAGKLALDAGLDMDMVSNIYCEELPKLLKNKQITMEQIDDAVRRVLVAKAKLGLMDDPFIYCNKEREKDLILNKEHRALAREAAEKSIVLLKNEKNLLPLDKNEIKTIALIGPLANNKEDLLGPWCAKGNPKDVVTLLQGLKNTLPPKTKVIYSKGCSSVNDVKDNNFKKAIEAAKNADVIIAALGESADMSGEAHSRSNIDLPGAQLKLLKQLKKTGKPIVLVLMNGRPLTINWSVENIPAILETWFLGIEAGNAIADVIFGDYNPSGKLTVSFPRSVGQVPIFYNHRQVGRPQDGPRDKNHFVSKYLDVPNSPLFPFGYGLSYTTFEYSDITLDKKEISKDENLTASIELTNTGKIAGKETVQVYIQDLFASVTQPVKRLIAFKQVILAPGEKQKIEFTITPSMLEIYNQDMKKVVEPGQFKLYIGTNSQEVKEAEFNVK